REDRPSQIRVRLRVLRLPRIPAEQVRDHLDLPAAARAGPDPDRRDPEPLGDRGGELLGDQLQNDCERSGLLDGERIAEEGSRLVPALAEDADLALGVRRLWRPADVAHGRDAGLDDRLGDPLAPDATLDLDGLRAGLGEEPAGVGDGYLGRG